MKRISPDKLTLTIVRPDGNTDIVDVSDRYFVIDEDTWRRGLYQQIIEETAKAGRGQVVGYHYTPAVWEDDYIGKCDRCGCTVDTRQAYSQQQWTWWGGRKVQVIAYYCDDCRQLLSSIGAGEITDLEHRAGMDIDSPEPTGKPDI